MTTRPQSDAVSVQREGQARAWGWRLVPFLVWLWLCFPLLAGWEMVGFRDAPNWYQPAWEWVDGQAWHWDAAPWNPWDGAGAPIAADPTIALFYPPRWLMRLSVGTHVWRFSVFLALHVLLSCVTAGVLARRLGCKPAGCAVAAMAYGLGGTVLFQVTNPIYLVGAAWLPLALAGAWSISRPETEDREWRRGFLLASAALAMMVLGGDVQLAYVGLLIAAMTCWWNWLKARTRNRTPVQHSGSMPNGRTRRSGIAPAALVPLTPTPLPPLKAERGEGPELDSGGSWRLLWAPVALGLAVGLLSLAQIWPSAEFARFSQRFSESHPQTIYDVAGALFREGWSVAGRDAAALFADPPPGTHPEQVYQFSQTPWSLLELFVPGFSGYPWPLNTRWLDGLPGADRMWNVSLYAGALVMLLAAMTVVFQREPCVTWLKGVGLFGIVGSLGWFGGGWLVREALAVAGADDVLGWLGRPAGGLYWLLVTLLPGMSGFRYPAKLFVTGSLAIALLAGRGLDGLDIRNRAIAFQISAAVMGLVWLAIDGAGWAADLVKKTGTFAVVESETNCSFGPVVTPLAVEVVHSGLCWAGAFCLIVGVCGILFHKRANSFVMTCVVLLVLDIGSWQGGAAPTVPLELLPAARLDAGNSGWRPALPGFRRFCVNGNVLPAAWKENSDPRRLEVVFRFNVRQQVSRHHWTSGCARFDGSMSLQPDRTFLPDMHQAWWMESAGGATGPIGRWLAPDAWLRPFTAENGETTECSVFVPRAGIMFPSLMQGDIKALSSIPDARIRELFPAGPDGTNTGCLAINDTHLAVLVDLPERLTLETALPDGGTLTFPEGWCGGWECLIRFGLSGATSAPWRVQRAVNARNWQFVLPAGVTGIQLRFCPVSWWLGVPACFTAWVFWLVLLGKTSMSGGGRNSVKTPQVDQLGNAGLNHS